MAEVTIDPEVRVKASDAMVTFIKDIVLSNSTKVPESFQNDIIETLSISDVTWIKNFLAKNREELIKTNLKLQYFHELMDGCTMILPEPKFPPRNPELESRIQKLKRQQDERDYKRITQNISGRLAYKEEPLSYQMKEMNSHLVMVLQFVVSVVTAFAFGYLAPYFFYGTVAVAPRILIGISVAFVVAIADLYFVIRYLLETEGIITRPKDENEVKTKVE